MLVIAERDYMVFHMHKSLFDFLSNEKAAGPFYVDAQVQVNTKMHMSQQAA
jgi:hypothetical protein